MLRNAHFQHKQIFVNYLLLNLFIKYFLSRISPQSPHTFHITAGLESRCRFLVFYCYLIVEFILGNFRISRHKLNFLGGLGNFRHLTVSYKLGILYL